MHSGVNLSNLKATLLLGVALFIAAIPTGCGSSAKVESRNTSVTLGQELKDLDEARNKGLLTEDEYNRKRDQLLKGK